MDNRFGPFYYMLRASGQGEVWHDSTDEAKFQQFGWRCSTGEDLYSPPTLLGNWAEERFDTRATASRRPLLSQFSHYFETTYSTTYNKEDKWPVCSTVRREARSFPGHQPELDPPHTKRVPNSRYRLDFSRAPGLRPTGGKQPGTEKSSSDLHQTVNGT